ncbi:copper amine oxidase N-terminal domain-containing protein [Ureibacillus sp. GCM10028918]|uniref:copper amine oxidase N-terminal domain-containing protein n=1 Tax=Ureibacillus sp. GCM10028918 TaxID=3273429 RepID=UPI003618BC77
MKKVFSLVFFVSILIFTSIPTYAASIQIKVDGVVISSDVNPEIRNNRTMVPLRVISENLGAKVHWSNSEVTLTKNDMQVTLKQNSDTVIKNGNTELLDVKPYIKNGRTFVPIRFIAETFDCYVNYKDLTVTVDTKPLVIDGKEVNSIQHEYRMTMGGIVQQIKGNAYNQAIYDTFIENRGKKVDAPAYYSWHFNIDQPGSYTKVGQYDFMNTEGKSMKSYDIYTLVEAFPVEALAGYPKVLIHDATVNQWYLFTETGLQSINDLVNTASNNGFIKIISNTVV